MIKSGLPTSPGRRLLAIILLLSVALLALGQIYVKATMAGPPRWIGLAGPAIWAIIGSAIWLLPEGWPSLSQAHRRLFASFFFALSALGLIFYFV
jgi:hypothetical protein